MPGHVTPRLHGLDALRGFALVLGVVLHAAMSFIPADHYWVVRDDDSSGMIAGLYFVIHLFRMTTFFVLAGFFARMSFHRLGAGAFARDRLKRIALPLVVGWLAVMPASIALSRWAMGLSYGPSVFATTLATPPAFSPRMLPLQHFWFLWLLLIFYALALAISWTANRVDPGFRLGRLAHRISRRTLSSRASLLLLAAPATLALAAIPGWTMWIGVPASDRGLIPEPHGMIAYGAAFITGWMLHRQIDLLDLWRRRAWTHLALAVALTALCLVVAGVRALETPVPGAGLRIAETYAYAVAGWSWTAALIGLSLRYLSAHSAGRRYLADASYWIYIVHMPVVIALQALVCHLPLAPWLKLAFILAAGLGVLLASYHLFVRRTIIGAVLNGKRAPPAGKRADAASAPARPAAG